MPQTDKISQLSKQHLLSASPEKFIIPVSSRNMLLLQKAHTSRKLLLGFQISRVNTLHAHGLPTCSLEGIPAASCDAATGEGLCSSALTHPAAPLTTPPAANPQTPRLAAPLGPAGSTCKRTTPFTLHTLVCSGDLFYHFGAEHLCTFHETHGDRTVSTRA